MNGFLIIILIIIWVLGMFYYYPKTLYTDMYYTPSWETPLVLLWFIWFPIKYIYEELKERRKRK